MNIPAHTTSYTIPTTGALFYSINLLFLDDPTTDISNVTFVDTNNIKGVQNVLFVISKYTGDPNYSMLARGQDLSTPLIMDATITTKQLYNYYSGQRIIKGIFFNPCIEKNSGTNESMPANEGSMWNSGMTQLINYFAITNHLPRPRTHKYFDGKYYPYYFDSNQNIWSKPY